MFQWGLFLCLVLVCIPGLLTAVRSAMVLIIRLGESALPAGETLPPRTVILVATMIQTLALITISAAVGTTLAHQVGFGAPFFGALIGVSSPWLAFKIQLLPALEIGAGGALLFLAAYYGFFRPRLDETTVEQMETLRNELGFAGRVLYGGIAEEVITRWGLLTVLVWLGYKLSGTQSPTTIWIAIILAGILFGLGHLPGYLAAGCRLSPMFLLMMLSLNLWASLLFGWLFWHVGLLAAMLAHSIFHLLWYPFDRYHWRCGLGRSNANGVEDSLQWKSIHVL